MKFIKCVVASCTAAVLALSLTGCAEHKSFTEVLRDMTCLPEYDYNMVIDMSGYDVESSDALNLEFSGRVDCTGAYSIITAPITIEEVTAPSTEIISSSDGDLYINTQPFFELTDENLDELPEELTSMEYIKISAEEFCALGEYYGLTDTSGLMDTQSVFTAMKSLQVKTIDFLDTFFTENNDLFSFDKNSYTYTFDCDKEKFGALLRTLKGTIEDGSLESYLGSIKDDMFTATGQTEEATKFDALETVSSIENYLNTVDLNNIDSVNLNASLVAPTHKDNSYRFSVTFDGSRNGDDNVSFVVSSTMTPTNGESVVIPENAVPLSDAVERLNAVLELSSADANAENVITEQTD